MSARSTRRTGLDTRRSKKGAHPQESAFDIYCINFYDKGLDAVRNAFVQQIKDGLRRSIFVIDLDQEIANAIETNEINSRLSKMPTPIPLPTDPAALTMLRIHECIETFELVSKKIDAEQNFDILRYWQRYMPAELKFKTVVPASQPTGRRSSGRNKTLKSGGTDTKLKVKVQCFSVTSKEHHKVGKGKPLSKRLYIKDQPMTVRILILIIGNLDCGFYKTLLELHQPLRGIIHFLPEQCGYDLLVPRPRREQQLRESIEKIQRDIHSLRKRIPTKPVGIFQQPIPQMSVCQAARYLKDIFDQLSWFIYDVHQLREQYEEFYVKPYQEINIKMAPTDSMQHTYRLAKSLRIQGHYMNTDMPMVNDDVGTIYMYLESLMNTFGAPRDLLSEMEVLLLANPSPLVQTHVLDKIKVYAHAFKSIVKLPKQNLLFVDHSNALLSSVVSYMDQTYLRTIYHACLEYNILRKYFSTGYIIDSLRYKPYAEEVDPEFLPKFAKLYLTDDSVTQRIIELVQLNDNYEIEEIAPHIKLYRFKKALNEVFEHQKQIILPTRLCFRDFTLYDMESFLADLVTHKMVEDRQLSHEKIAELQKVSSVLKTHQENGGVPGEPYTCNTKPYVVTPSVFIRPQSLKADRLIEQKKEKDKDKKGDKDKENDKGDRQTFRQSKSASIPPAANNQNSFIGMNGLPNDDDGTPIIPAGLGPDHPLLKGYNLDDTRQTIKVKTSKYFFEEGNMTLYQEKWNFRQTNKCLSIDIDKHIIHFSNPIGDMTTISPDVRIQTPNGVSLRIKPEAQECSKAVLNYPNGLTLYCLDTHAEHHWSGHQSELNEKRRICTPYGAVIVFYNDNDTILIMRYNGEVYRLYAYLDVMVENDGEEGEEYESSEFINACSTRSTYSSYRPLETKMKKRERRSREAGGVNKISTSSSNSAHSLAMREAILQARQLKMQQDQALYASIDSELKFLEMLMQLFEFSYKHLKLTTSLGSVVHVERESERIYCDKPVVVTEWHDYYVNESYSMRNDGVHMIWTHDGLKCYHADGTIIITGTIDGIDRGVVEDEIDVEISSSSSHDIKKEPDPVPVKKSDSSHSSGPILVNDSKTGLVYAIKRPSTKMDMGEYLAEGEVEDMSLYDYTFATYLPNSYTILHRSYAGLQFIFSHINKIDLKLETKIFAADNIQVYIHPLPDEKVSSTPDLLSEASEEFEQQVEIDPEKVSSEADPDEWTRLPPRLSRQSRVSNASATKKSSKKSMPSAVDIESSQFLLELRGNEMKLSATLRKFGCDENALLVWDKILLKLQLEQNLTIVFRNWVETFHRFINCACPKWRTTYFVEYEGDACLRKGIELFKTAPKMGEYGFSAGNIYIDPVKLKSVQNQMVNYFDWYGKDLAKFPRFKEDQKTSKFLFDEEFPGVLNTKIFLQIPTQLAFTDRIHLFLEPFDKIKFRKMKHRFKQALLFHLNPKLRDLIRTEMSKRSWYNRHAANRKRQFMEQQRLSLYRAMLKHKVYPNYFQFKDRFFGHVRHIDFFDFMSSKCNENDHPSEYVEQDGKGETGSKKPKVSSKELNKYRKKCMCPKYINSL